MGFTLLVHLLAATPDQSQVSNTASATSDTADPDTGNNSATVRTTAVTPKADLEVSKTGPATAMVDTDFSYHVAVQNLGPEDAHNVVLSDVLPALLSFVSFSFDASDPPSACGLGQTVTCSVPLLVSGATMGFTLLVHLLAGTPDQSQVSNTASATSDTADPDTGNNSATVRTTAVTPKADLEVSKTGPATAMVDTDFSYHVAVQNLGPEDAHNVVLSDVLPALLSFVSFSFDASDPPSACGLGQTVTCSVPLLVSGATMGFTLLVHLLAGTPDQSQVSNTASATSDTADPEPGNNSGSVTTTAVSRADLSVTKQGPTSAAIGDEISYDITVHNGGPSTAVNVALDEVVSSGLQVISTTVNAGWLCTFPGAHALRCTAASFAAGATVTFTVTLRVNAA